MKKLVLVSLFFVTSIFLAACGGGSSEESNTSEGETTIKVAAWNAAANALTDQIEGFNKKYPDIKVEILQVDPEYSKVTPALAAGTGAPDIIQTQARDFPAFLNKFPDQFVDLTEKTKDYQDKFLESSWESVSKDGKVYAMPWDIGPSALYYRKDLFEKAGIDIASIKTWEDYIEAGKELKKAIPETTMTGYTNDFDLYEVFLNQLGGTYVKDGKINVNSPESKEALLLQKEMKDEDVAISVKDWNGRITELNNEKIASVILPVWYAGTLQHSVEQQAGNWGIVPLPAFEEGGNTQANLGGSILTISKQSKNADAAFKFIEYVLTTEEGQTVMLNYGLFPSYTPFYQSEVFKEYNDYFEMEVYPFFAGLTSNIEKMDHGPIMLDATKPVNDMIGAVLEGKDVDKSMETAATSISKTTNLDINE
ncbi:ABC transporter substrate-binding protein [Metabacillus rhizolycopersici]|uniref:Sugar ABC transporter substrate-binding protein n=1 Tax=Metabacillus rhizolycopersici TaxID=2875709 RepID=A0ABS7US47_9BACI|nr:sugar ABC transporter substrate-binding protein [Metabacillus rhizolycopersici]MBZ5750869.1 sugar ABC transporter substrate-binding protein [Metabacillus rhizolycopersici]